MSQSEVKQTVASAALGVIKPKLTQDAVIGIGTGSTTNFFIDALAEEKHRFSAAVSSSTATTNRLQNHGIQVIDLNDAPSLAIYVDGADEVDPSNALIKGGGAALTREKIVAASADEFVCIVDDTKVTDTLGRFPLPVEVLPMARNLATRALADLGGKPIYREGIVTDNGNIIIDVHELRIGNPDALERAINNIVGVVSNGIFAANRPAIVLVGSTDGVEHR